MRMKKIIGVVMAISLIVSCLVGCSNNTKNDANDDSQSTMNKKTVSQSPTEKGEGNYTAPGTMPIVKEPITLTILAPQDGEYSRYENLQTKELEELTGIHIEWITTDKIREKMNLMFSSGEMPDIVMLGVGSQRLDKATEASLGAQGLIIPLNQYFETISVGYKEAFEKLEGMRDYITTPDGKIYSLPNVDASLHMQYSYKMWINTTWLDNLGLEMPTTTEEFYQVMKAFKEQDANGNGDPNDEIPFSTVKGDGATQIDGFLMNSFQLTPATSRLYLDNGKVTFSPVQDNYREGLRYLNKLYKEGLINPESFTQDLNNQVNVNEGGDATKIGAFIAGRPGYACDLKAEPNSKRWEQYQPLPPLTGPSGTVVAAWNPYVIYQTGMTFITSECKEPEAAFRLIDYLATKEGSYRSALGIEGINYRKAEIGELGLDGKQALVTSLPAIDTNPNRGWGQLAGLVRYPEDTAGITTNPDPYAPDVKPLAGRQVLMYKGSKDQESVRQPLESVLPDLYTPEEDIEELTLLKTTIMDYTRESIVGFVTGAMDVEKDWDAYIKQMNSLGLSRYIELLQKSYDISSFAK